MASQPRVLILPAGNTLSHVAQALALAGNLEASGVECHLAMASVRTAWAAQFHPRCHVVSELWELSGQPFPCLRWFSNRDHVERCLATREELIQRLQPALVIGIFDFLSRPSARGIPVLAINGACMLPWFTGVLGLSATDTPFRQEQKHTLESFWTYAAQCLAPALKRRQFPVPAQAHELLLGDHNFIYELPELCGVPDLPQECQAIGPIFWPQWEQIGTPPPWTSSDPELTVYFSVGSLAMQGDVWPRLIAIAEQLGVRVLAATGMGGFSQTHERCFCRPFLSPLAAAQAADVAVCTGGIGVCYQNLAAGVPSLIVPSQPEQATNGLHFQHQGCARALVPEVAFTGHTKQYADAIDYAQVAATLREMIEQRADFAAPIERMQRRLATLDALHAIGDFVRSRL